MPRRSNHHPGWSRVVAALGIRAALTRAKPPYRRVRAPPWPGAARAAAGDARPGTRRDRNGLTAARPRRRRDGAARAYEPSSRGRARASHPTGAAAPFDGQCVVGTSIGGSNPLGECSLDGRRVAHVARRRFRLGRRRLPERAGAVGGGGRAFVPGSSRQALGGFDALERLLESNAARPFDRVRLDEGGSARSSPTSLGRQSRASSAARPP